MKLVKLILIISILTTSIFADRGQVEGFVERFYVTVLDRDSEEAGLDYWSDNLLSGSEAGADIARGFIFSGEFTNRATTNDAYVYVLYRAFFDREPDSRGLNYWTDNLNSGKDRHFILDGFLYSQEFSNLCTKYGIEPTDKHPNPNYVPSENNATVVPSENNATVIPSEKNSTVVPSEKNLITSKVKKTGQTLSYIDFDDGHYQKGIEPNYTRNIAIDTITDNLRGLMWQDNLEAKTVKKPWFTEDQAEICKANVNNCNDTSGDTAVTYCSELTLGEYNDWRLPTVEELIDVANFTGLSSNFNNNINMLYTSSSNYIYNSNFYMQYVILDDDLDMDIGIYSFNTLSSEYQVRCVRDISTNIKSSNNFTRGATTGIVTDNNTALQWQDASLNKIEVDIDSAIEYCESFELSGYDDWRLPNINEIYTIYNFKNKSIFSIFQNARFNSNAFITSTSRANHHHIHHSLNSVNASDLDKVICVRN